jgi:hypothetical protein
MRGRGAWFGFMRWDWNANLHGVGKISLMVDCYAFLLACLIGVVGWAYIGSRHVSSTFNGAYRDQLRRGSLLCAAAAVPLIASVILDTILTGLRLFELDLPASALVPLLLIATELAFATMLSVEICKTILRAARASSLFCN